MPIFQSILKLKNRFYVTKLNTLIDQAIQRKKFNDVHTLWLEAEELLREKLHKINFKRLKTVLKNMKSIIKNLKQPTKT